MNSIRFQFAFQMNGGVLPIHIMNGMLTMFGNSFTCFMRVCALSSLETCIKLV
jgi:hypothetical protein